MLSGIDEKPALPLKTVGIAMMIPNAIAVSKSRISVSVAGERMMPTPAAASSADPLFPRLVIRVEFIDEGKRPGVQPYRHAF